MDTVNQQSGGEQKSQTVWYVVGVVVVVAALVALYYLVTSRELTSITPPVPEIVPGIVIDEDVAEVVPTAAQDLQALEAQGIPYEFLASSGLFLQPIVIDCVNFFKIISFPLYGFAI